MKTKTREKLAASLYLLIIVTAAVAECIPVLLVSFAVFVAVFLIVCYAPEPKRVKEKKTRPIYTQWDACWRISQNLPH